MSLLTIETYFLKEEYTEFLHDVVDTSVYMSPYLSLPIFPYVPNP